MKKKRFDVLAHGSGGWGVQEKCHWYLLDFLWGR